MTRNEPPFKVIQSLTYWKAYRVATLYACCITPDAGSCNVGGCPDVASGYCRKSGLASIGLASAVVDVDPRVRSRFNCARKTTLASFSMCELLLTSSAFLAFAHAQFNTFKSAPLSRLFRLERNASMSRSCSWNIGARRVLKRYVEPSVCGRESQRKNTSLKSE